jgi:tetraacyldisaccharide 4'-kinase
LQPINIHYSILLLPLAAIYWLITSIRDWCYDVGFLKSTSFDIPLVSVGNLAVGGSGKTPMVEYLIRELKSEYTIATLSRGYGRKTKGFRWVEPHLSPTETGDEPLQIKTKFNEIAVAVCEDRVAGVHRILKERPETNLILLDDAFQHRAIKPLVQILLSTCEYPYFQDYLMPVGRLRESRRGAKRADATIYTKCPSGYVSINYGDEPKFYSTIQYSDTKIDGPIFGFSGLAKNDVFAKHLASQYDLWGFKGYKDHYSYSQNDLEELRGLAKGATLVCTEKDWMKIKQLEGYEKIKHVSITNKIEGVVNFISWLKRKVENK